MDEVIKNFLETFKTKSMSVEIHDNYCLLKWKLDIGNLVNGIIINKDKIMIITIGSNNIVSEKLSDTSWYTNINEGMKIKGISWESFWIKIPKKININEIKNNISKYKEIVTLGYI